MALLPGVEVGGDRLQTGVGRSARRGALYSCFFFATPPPISCNMMLPRPAQNVIERLRAAGLRPTRQRLALARLLFENGDRHVTAEVLHGEALTGHIRVSLATVYNTLHQFTAVRLLREVA